MHKFYEDLKNYILQQEDELKKNLIPYYETLLQLENYPEMKDLLNTYQSTDYVLDYNEPDEDNYYSIGWLEVYEMYNPITFKIELEIGNMQGNYCQCEPTQKGYVASEGCCGIDCDVYLPKVNITKEINLINHEFQGYERDLWALKEKWYTEYEKENESKKQLEYIKSIESKIEYHQKELELAKAQLK